ncbi:MAG: hypothetical protein Kow0022_05770 [Phycisphaerales bacterium]
MVLLLNLAWWGVTILVQKPERAYDATALSRVKRRFVLTYGLAGVFGMIAVAIGATIVNGLGASGTHVRTPLPQFC